MNTRQIADDGVELVKRKLLALGVHVSVAPNNRTELWADEEKSGRRLVIKVTTNEKPKPGGGKGALAVDWWVRADLPAHFVAFVDLSTESVWLMKVSEVLELAQQRSGGRLHLYMYTDRSVESRTGRPNRIVDFERYRIDARASDLHAHHNTC